MNIEIVVGYDGVLDGYDPSEVIALTFSEANWNDISTRGGTMSNRITINDTANNRRVLGALSNVRDVAPQAIKKHSCEIKSDSLRVMKGFLIVWQIQGGKIELGVYGQAASFFNQIGDQTINELDFSSLDHDWTAANVNAKRQATTGVVYPNINYGRWTGETKASRPHTDFFPSVYLNTILETGATEVGYTLQNYTSSTALPFSKEGLMVNRQLIDARLDMSANELVSLIYAVPTYLDNLDVITFDSGSHIFTDYYLTREGGTYDFEVNVIHAPRTTPVAGIIRAVITADSGKNTAEKSIGEVSFNNTLSGEFKIKVKGYQYDSTKPRVRLVFYGSSGREFNLKEGTYFKCVSGQEKLHDGDLIAIQETLPNIKLRSLFIFEAVRLNSLIQVDDSAKTIEFITLDSIKAKKYQAKDWSNKVDLSEDPKIQFRLDGYAQTNYLKWKEGITEDPVYDANNDIGRGTIAINDTALELTKDLYEAPFAASGLTNSFSNGEQCAIIPKYSSTSLAYTDSDLDPEFRILEVSIDDRFLVDITSETVLTTQANTSFKEFDDLIEDNYTALKSMLTNTKYLEVLVNLNASDINQLDITTPVYLLDEYWFIQQVKQWKVNSPDSTIVKLIRL